jgi:hypothetical protein
MTAQLNDSPYSKGGLTTTTWELQLGTVVSDVPAAPGRGSEDRRTEGVSLHLPAFPASRPE